MATTGCPRASCRHGARAGCRGTANHRQEPVNTGRYDTRLACEMPAESPYPPISIFDAVMADLSPAARGPHPAFRAPLFPLGAPLFTLGANPQGNLRHPRVFLRPFAPNAKSTAPNPVLEEAPWPWHPYSRAVARGLAHHLFREQRKASSKGSTSAIILRTTGSSRPSPRSRSAHAGERLFS